MEWDIKEIDQDDADIEKLRENLKKQIQSFVLHRTPMCSGIGMKRGGKRENRQKQQALDAIQTDSDWLSHISCCL